MCNRAAHKCKVSSVKSTLQRPPRRTLADVDKDGKLRAEEFILAMHLVDVAKTGQPLPLTLPSELVPPSQRYVDINDSSPSVQKVDVFRFMGTRCGLQSSECF